MRQKINNAPTALQKSSPVYLCRHQQQIIPVLEFTCMNFSTSDLLLLGGEKELFLIVLF